MEKEVIAALIGAGGGIVAALIGKLPVEKVTSYILRRRSNIPEIMHTKWKAEWKYEDGSPLPSGTVTFIKWTKDNLFEGFGEITYPNKQYKYSIRGEVSPRGVVVLTYKAEGFPTEANIGTASLLLSTDAQGLTGTWVGFEGTKQPDGTEVFKLRGGKVTMHKIKDLKP